MILLSYLISVYVAAYMLAMLGLGILLDVCLCAWRERRARRIEAARAALHWTLRTNPLLEELPWIPSNGAVSHRTTIKTELPRVNYKKPPPAVESDLA